MAPVAGGKRSHHPSLILYAELISILLVTSFPVSTSKVIILGAGGAGLACAHTLEQAGSNDYVILEAQSVIGGRMQNVDFGGTVIQSGANWVQGTEGSWLWSLVNNAGVQGTLSDWDSLELNDRDSDSDYADYDNISGPGWVKYEEATACATKVAMDLVEEHRSDMSVRQAMRLCGWTAHDEIEKAIEWMLHDFEYGEPPVTTSAKNSLETTAYDRFKDEDFFVTDPRGWVPALEQLTYDPARIHFGHTVTQVETLAAGGARVHAVTADGGKVTFDADHVICTFSIGVLQHSVDTLFSPRLPQWKREEVFKFDMVTYTKIFITFPTTFWENHDFKEQFYLYADERRGYFPLWQNMNAEGFFDPEASDPMLMVTAVGDEALRLEQETDEAVMEECLAVLRAMFGPDVPQPISIYVPRWNANPLFRGSYSNWPIGVSATDHAELRTPVGPIFISGEATHPTLNGYVHGALEAGKQTARELLSCLTDVDSAICKCVYDIACSVSYEHSDQGEIVRHDETDISCSKDAPAVEPAVESNTRAPTAEDISCSKDAPAVEPAVESNTRAPTAEANICKCGEAGSSGMSKQRVSPAVLMLMGIWAALCITSWY